MFLFYNKSDFIIQGFGVCDFAEMGMSNYNPSIHTQYEGDFEIPVVSGDLKEEIQIAKQDQTLFTLTTFTYLLGKANITVYVNDECVDSFTETSESSITFDSGLNEGDVVRFNSIEIYLYQFDEETNTFSRYIS